MAQIPRRGVAQIPKHPAVRTTVLEHLLQPHVWAHFPRKWQHNLLQTVPVVQHLLQAHIGTFLEAIRTTKKYKPYNTCGGRTTVDLHINRGIFVTVPVWVFMSVRVEGMISCVVGIFLSILLNNNFLLSRVFPKI